MNSIQKLTEYFSRFPGIGPRQARRFVYFLLTEKDGSLADFAALIKNLKIDITICKSCYRFFQKNGNGRRETDQAMPICDICSNHTARREPTDDCRS